MLLRRPICLLATLIILAVAGAVQSDDEPAAPVDGNPYLARDGLSPDALLDFIDRMQAKPKTIRGRAGFAEAVLDAADRILASPEASDQHKTAAVVERLKLLHDLACRGQSGAEDDLAESVRALTDDARPAVAQQVAFLRLERKALQADDLPAEQLPALLAELRACFEAEPPQARHLRLASATVRIINRLPDDASAGRAYVEFGRLFARSDDRELSRYGRQIEKGAKPATLVGKPLELEGTLVDGGALDWASYRGKVVLVDFWATWCGPCRAELPNVKAAYAAYHERGFEVLGVSLDEDRQALTQFLADEQIPWANLFGDGEAGGWKHPLAVKYDIHAIPATFLLDRTGKVVAQDVRGPELAKQLDKLLEGEAARPAGDK